ncbi:SH3 domain-containing protein [Hoeflea sp. WL0058]|uniref:SH3 domain-containing protein n=1 Tax=Flavimaribacter sediminis TaxID=2865987 RepID=A0AAE3D340_9HYPH|nr:SH3 domain-containing protein [Flavimaribacter sediminis]MBW8639426.1 SH3 domain-containing protein [Flavimaribacter sediminis]
MNRFRIAVVVLIVSIPAMLGQAYANAFVAWQVSDVAWNDILNVRAWPSSKSAIRAGYPNGAPLSMTGKCMNGVDLKNIAGLPHWKQRQMVRYTWCEVWHDPTNTGDWQNGWVYGKYIAPM